jgi:hypothetical protein
LAEAAHVFMGGMRGPQGSVILEDLYERSAFTIG